MKIEFDIAKICLILTIVGITGLFVIVQTIQPKVVRIREIDTSIIGQLIEVNATIKSISKDGHVFFNLEDGNDSIKAIMFERDAKNHEHVYELKKNDNVTVIGEVNNYRGELEIVVKNIRKMS